jgi:hypothetical protein
VSFPKLTGTEVSGSNPLQELWSWLGTLGDAQPATADALGAAHAVSTSSRMMAMSCRLVKSGPHRSCCSARMTPTGCSRRLGGFMPSMGLAWRSPSATAHLQEGVETTVAVVGGRRLPASELVGDEVLDVLAC